MPKKSKVPPPEEKPDESLENEISDNDMTANIIHEEDFDTKVPEDVKFLPDSETELLPSTVEKELQEDWRKIQESEGGYLPESEPQEPEDKLIAVDEPQEENTVEDIPAKTSIPTPRKAPRSEPPKPAWKIHAEQIFAEREAQKQKMIQDRRQYEESHRGSKEQQAAQIREGKQEADAEVQAKIDALRKEKETALDEMVERIREENERKRIEREAVDEQLRKEREARSYKANRDVDSRASRLSKKEE